jgi:hypothetical protein
MLQNESLGNGREHWAVKLLISGSMVRARVRPPSKSKSYAGHTAPGSSAPTKSGASSPKYHRGAYELRAKVARVGGNREPSARLKFCLGAHLGRVLARSWTHE